METTCDYESEVAWGVTGPVKAPPYMTPVTGASYHVREVWQGLAIML